jgi:hypothetical protein
VRHGRSRACVYPAAHLHTGCESLLDAAKLADTSGPVITRAGGGVGHLKLGAHTVCLALAFSLPRAQNGVI